MVYAECDCGAAYKAFETRPRAVHCHKCKRLLSWANRPGLVHRSQEGGGQIGCAVLVIVFVILAGSLVWSWIVGG